MKNFLTCLSFLSITGLYSQSLKYFSVPKEYKKIAEVNGDLDKDGQDETVLAFDTDTIASDYETYSEKKDYKRVFYILKKERFQNRGT